MDWGLEFGVWGLGFRGFQTSPEILDLLPLNPELREPSAGLAEVDRLAWLLNPQLDLSRSTAEFKGVLGFWGLNN